MGWSDSAAGDPVSQPSAAEVRVTGASLDSRSVQPGDLYLALPGSRAHGAQFCETAVTAGAVAVLTDAAGAELVHGVPCVVVDDPRAVMGRIASELYANPAADLSMFAVTGTNGKTTTAFLLEACLTALGRHPGVVGTIGYRVDGRPVASSRTTVTTPESVDLQALLAVFAELGADSVAMEVSSHAMALHRTDPIVFDVAAFTNLGRDHLDFHHTQEEYFEAKATLFTAEHTTRAVICTDDEWGRRLASRVRDTGEVALLTTGRSDADVRLLSAVARPDQTQLLTITVRGRELQVVLGMPGEHNAANATTALAMIAAIGWDVAAAARGLAGVVVPGRMQRIDLGADAPTVVVDFAHTPQAIEATLRAVRAGLTEGARSIAVLGAGGDRDVTKREPMGRVAAELSDIVVVTDDNPRSEPPETIRARVLAGARGGTAEVHDGGDRRSAIRAALALAGAADTVVLLGKGHEQGQDIGGVVSPFDDALVSVEAWQELNR